MVSPFHLDYLFKRVLQALGGWWKGVRTGFNNNKTYAYRLETLTKAVRSAGALVAPHLAALVSSLLEATQNAEGTSLNYLSVRLGGQQHATQVHSLSKGAFFKRT